MPPQSPDAQTVHRRSVSLASLCPTSSRESERQMRQINKTTRKLFVSRGLTCKKLSIVHFQENRNNKYFVSSWCIFTTSGVVYFCPHKKLWTICPFHSESGLISVPRAKWRPELGWINITWAFVSLGILPPVECWILCKYVDVREAD